MELGYALICEEHPPEDLVADAAKAEEAGFSYLSVSDHYHPWLEAQGQSPYAWSVLGALTQRVDIGLMTQVTCPTKRYHPAVVAQKAATTARLATGGFVLGLGTGELLNEHVVGGEWPDPVTRFEMLEEAVEVIRELFTGDVVSHRGEFFTVDRARLYTLPSQPPPIAIAAGGPQAARMAAKLAADLVMTSPDEDLIAAYRDAGGERTVHGQATVCWSEDADAARKILHETWRQSALDWDANAEIVDVAGFESATQTVRMEDVTGSKPMGSDIDEYLESLAMYRDAGFDRLALHNVGPHQEGFLDWCRDELLPAVER